MMSGMGKGDNFLKEDQKTTGARMHERFLCLDIDTIAEEEAKMAKTIAEEKCATEMLKGIVSVVEKTAKGKKEMCETEMGEDAQEVDVGEDDGGVFGERMVRIVGIY